MTRLLLAMVIIGGVFVFMAVQDMRLNSKADVEPQIISCAELELNGPGDNLHVNLTDFLICESAYVYEEKTPGGTWSKVWVPAVPLGGAYHLKLLSMVDEQGHFTGQQVPTPTDVKVIVKAENLSNERELSRMAARDNVQGMIVNLISSLGSEEKRLLEESYPSVDFDDCFILEVGRKPAGMAGLLGFGFGGMAMMATGGGIFLARRRA